MCERERDGKEASNQRMPIHVTMESRKSSGVPREGLLLSVNVYATAKGDHQCKVCGRQKAQEQGI